MWARWSNKERLDSLEYISTSSHIKLHSQFIMHIPARYPLSLSPEKARERIHTYKLSKSVALAYLAPIAHVRNVRRVTLRL